MTAPRSETRLKSEVVRRTFTKVIESVQHAWASYEEHESKTLFQIRVAGYGIAIFYNSILPESTFQVIIKGQRNKHYSWSEPNLIDKLSQDLKQILSDNIRICE